MCSTVPPIPGVAMYAADPARVLMVRDRTGRPARVCGASVWQPVGFTVVAIADHLHALAHAREAAMNGWRTANQHNPQVADQWRNRVLDVHAQITEWQP